MPSKSCKLDIIPTWLYKECLDYLLPVTTTIVNASMQHGVFPDCFKLACVKPILKKAGSETDDLKNYRPVSNLNFLSKVVEKAVVNK